MKKALSFILALSLVVGSSAAVFAKEDAAKDTSMQFQGPEIKLSLDQALERMTTTGPAFEAVMLEKDGNDAAARGQFEAIDAIEDAREQAQQLPADLRVSVPSLNSLTGKQATLAKDY